MDTYPIQPAEAGPGTAAKTSPAAAFALVLGVAALVCVLTVIFAPVGLVLGIIGLILGIVALRMTRRPGVTGRGVAIGGLVLSVIAVLVAIAFAAGVTTFLNNEKAVDRLERQVEDLRDKLPR
jgi:membrane-bound ClpP family serine protease